MSRIEPIEPMTTVEPDITVADDDDAAVAEWLWFGRIAQLFCLWAAMAIPVFLVIDARIGG